MAKKCNLTKEKIHESIYEKAFENDENVLIVNDKIMFSNKDAFEKFKNEIENLFDIKGIGTIVHFIEEANTAIIDKTDILEEMDAFENPPLTLNNVTVTTPEYHLHPENIQFYKDYVKKMKANILKINRKMKQLREDFTHADTKYEADKIKREIKQYIIVREGLDKQIEKIEKNVPSMTKKLEEIKETLEYILREFENMTNPHLIEMVNDIFNEADTYSEMLGDPKYTSKKYPQHISEKDEIALRSLRSDIKTLHLSFDRLLYKQSQKFLAENPILLSDEKMKKILAHPESDEYKKMFGGAAISDINFLEKLGLNVDTSSTFDGVLGQLLFHEMERIAQDINNDIYEKKKLFMSIAKKMKSIGIDMESGSDMDFIYEKDEHGNKTGTIISTFTYEFKKKMIDLSKAIREKKTADVLDMMMDDFEVFDISKLGFIHENRDSIMAQGGFKAEFYECCERIFKEITGKDSGFSKYLASRKYDSDYENKLKRNLGEKMYNEMCENMMSKVIEYYYSNQGNINNTQHKNPFKIIERAEDIKAGKTVDTTFNQNMYRFSSMSLIPKNDNGYNQDFRRMFIDSTGEKSNILNEFYDFVYDNYTLFSLLYNNKNTLRAAFLKDNAADMLGDAVRGIARFDDMGSNMRKIKNGMLQWLSDSYWDENYISSDASAVSLNYSDTAEKKYRNILDAINMKNSSEINKMAKDNGITRSDYKNDEEFHKAIARKISLQGYNQNFYEVTMKMFDLYAAQKARNEAYPMAKTIERLYSQYTNEKGHTRENAMERMRDNIRRSIQKIKLDDDGKLNYKLSNLSIIRNLFSKFDSIPIVGKFLETSFMKRLSEDEKDLVDMIKKAKDDIEGEENITFTFEDETFQRSKNDNEIRYYKLTEDGEEFYRLRTEDEINNFKEKLTKYYENKLAMLGTDATLQNVVNLIRNLLMYKMLAGVSTSGIFNRIEGHLANAEMDATGYFWTPGNLNYVEQFFLGAGLQRFITKSGEKSVVKHLGADEESQWIKRLDIVRKLSDRTNIFQDMKNMFDRTIEGAQKGVLRHNLDLFQLSVTNPEFKNQMSIVLAILMDIEIEDNNGNRHKMFDKKTGEFTAFDIKNGELVLKPEFDNVKNRNWINFQSTVIEKNGKNEIKVISPSFDFSQKCKIAIKNIHGDYRKNAALGYNNNMVLSHLMMLKRWLPSKIMRGWSAGGSDNNTGGFDENYQLFGGKVDQKGSVAQRGMWRDTLEKGKGPLTMLLPVVLSTFRLHKGILQTIAGAGGSVYFIGKVIKDKLGARQGQIESNVTMLEESAEMVKALAWEIGTFIPRNLPRVFGKNFEFNAAKHSFTDQKFIDEYGDITLGNFRACARQMASYFYITALGVIVKLIFWHPEDGDDDDRRKMFNFMDNNFENILSSLSSTLFMIDNIEDKTEISNIPIIRLTNDMGKFVSAVNEMNAEKIIKYGEKLFVPIRIPYLRNKFNPFANDFEYLKDTWDDRLIKNIRTDNEWGSEQDYKNIRADMKKQYVKMWENEELPDYAINILSSQVRENGYESIYEVPESVFKNMVSKSILIPSRKQKEYKNKDYKFMRAVLMDEYENNPYLKNHTLRYIFGGYNNTLKAYFQREIKGEISDNPYFDDED